MRVYIVEVISNSNPSASKISQDGFFKFEDAQKWCRKRLGIKKELQNGWKFIADDYEYRIHDILVG